MGMGGMDMMGGMGGMMAGIGGLGIMGGMGGMGMMGMGGVDMMGMGGMDPMYGGDVGYGGGYGGGIGGDISGNVADNTGLAASTSFPPSLILPPPPSPTRTFITETHFPPSLGIKSQRRSIWRDSGHPTQTVKAPPDTTTNNNNTNDDSNDTTNKFLHWSFTVMLKCLGESLTDGPGSPQSSPVYLVIT